jgi:hypothetical protein
MNRKYQLMARITRCRDDRTDTDWQVISSCQAESDRQAQAQFKSHFPAIRFGGQFPTHRLHTGA